MPRILWAVLSLCFIVTALPMAYVLCGLGLNVYAAVWLPTLASVLSLLCAMHAER